MLDPTTYAERILLAAMKRRGLDIFALRALQKATHLLALALGERLRQLRESADPKERILGRIQEQSLHVQLLLETLDILASRWDKLPERQRPHYAPEARFRILRIKALLALSAEDAARTFRVSASTVVRWEQETTVRPDLETIGSLLKPVPPVRRYADVVRQLVQTMTLAGFSGSNSVAQTLARAGWKLARRTVQRMRKEAPARPPDPGEGEKAGGVTARHPNHVWMMDLTEIPSLFRLFSFKLAVVLDVFSRMPLAARVFTSEPTALEMTGLFRQAATIHGTPTHFVSDQGSQFTAGSFRDCLIGLGVRQRFGAIGRAGSIAIIERLWKSLKGTLRLCLVPPLTEQDLQRRLELALMHYAYLRPHQGLGGATPAEVYIGIRPAHLAAVPPPRGRPGKVVDQAPFEVTFLDPERRLPFLINTAA